jgi:urease accessory protein
MPLGALPRSESAIAEISTAGRLELVADVTSGGRTYLSRRCQRFPLRITAPLYLDPTRRGMAYVYMQNPTGGLFEGDDHLISLTARPGTLVHLTTQAASKVYRCDGSSARQRIDLAVAAGAFAEYVPDPLIPHAGAQFEQELVADVEPDGALIATETLAPGRVAFGEEFEYTRLRLSTRISCAGQEAAVDSLVLEPGKRQPCRAGVLGDYAYVASLFAVAPRRDCEALARTVSEAIEGIADCLSAAAILPSNSGVLARILAPSGIPATRALEAAWSAARLMLLGGPAPRRRK